VLYRETHKLLEDLADATIDGTRKQQMELFASVPLLIIDDLGMRTTRHRCRRPTGDRDVPL